MENKKIILQQDDCAPDSYEYFEKDFKRITGLSVNEFRNIGKELNEDVIIYNNFILGLKTADYQFYTLYQIESKIEDVFNIFNKYDFTYLTGSYSFILNLIKS